MHAPLRSLTVQEALEEMSRPKSGPGIQARFYQAGEIGKEDAIEWVTCAILARRGEPFEGWERHAPAVRKALSLCIHELAPEECKVCNGEARRLIEEGGEFTM